MRKHYIKPITEKYSYENIQGYYVKTGYNLIQKNSALIEEILSAPSNISNLEKGINMIGDCGECPSCACIEGGLQFLAVIEAPAVVPLLVVVGGISLTS